MKPRLCCIEPSGVLRQALVRLAQDKGWEVDACADLQEAEDILKRHSPDLITTASVLPSGDLEQTIGRLRALTNTETVPIVLLTATADAPLATRALEAGITEVFQKDDLASFQIYLEAMAKEDGEDLTGRRMLVLEDDRAVGLYIQAILAALGPEVELFDAKADALTAAMTAHYDLIVTDLVLGQGKSGNNFIRLLRQSNGKSAAAPIIAISGFSDDARRIEALRAGAETFLEKPMVDAELQFHALRLLRRRPSPYACAGRQAVLSGAQTWGLSEREQLICGLVGAGYSDKDIAGQLGSSYWTVRTHLGRIFRKCGVANRIELGNVLRRGAETASPLQSEAQIAEMDWRTLSAHVMDHLHYGLVITDQHRVILQINPAFSRITGYCAAEVIGMTPCLFQSGKHDDAFYRALNARLQAQGRWSGELWNRHKNGHLYLAWADISRLAPDMPLGAHYIGVLSDITERHLDTERMRHNALHDTLTGLANRNLLKDRMQHEIARAKRTGSMFACLFIDLDRFKPINDTLGHAAGDHVLNEIAHRLRSIFRTNDTLARFGGDEFVALAPDITDRHAALTLSNKVLNAFSTPILINTKECCVGASIGISLYPHDAENFSMLLAHADAAMYRAKEAGGNRASFHEPTLTHQANDRQVLQSHLRQAIDCGEFELWFQPKFELAQGHIVGAEALLRWNHPERGLVAPDEFITLAENTGLIVPLGDWVLREACRVLQRIREQGHADFTIAVNISPQQIARHDFVGEVSAALSASSSTAQNLQLEITESTLQYDPTRVGGIIHRLAEAGVSMALDNFGGGQSNLASLHQLPFVTLKVDRRVIHNVHADRYKDSFARAALQLANGLDMKMVAEGVENSLQAEYLRDIGCHHVQGYFFGRPTPEVELLALLQGQAA